MCQLFPSYSLVASRLLGGERDDRKTNLITSSLQRLIPSFRLRKFLRIGLVHTFVFRVCTHFAQRNNNVPPLLFTLLCSLFFAVDTQPRRETSKFHLFLRRDRNTRQRFSNSNISQTQIQSLRIQLQKISPTSDKLNDMK